jgi:hypothetical protein
MPKVSNSTRLDDSMDRYKNQRALDKYEGNYDGNGAGPFHTAEFKNCVDYLRSLANRVEFTAEDLEDMARAALLVDAKRSVSA